MICIRKVQSVPNRANLRAITNSLLRLKSDLKRKKRQKRKEGKHKVFETKNRKSRPKSLALIVCLVAFKLFIFLIFIEFKFYMCSEIKYVSIKSLSEFQRRKFSFCFK